MSRRPDKMILELVRQNTLLPPTDETNPYQLPQPSRRQRVQAPSFTRRYILVRTPSEWLRVTIFFTVFYSGLLCYWIILYHIFYYVTLTFNTPMYLLSQPGISMEPCDATTGEICYVQYTQNDDDQIYDNVMLMEKALYKFGSSINRAEFGPCTAQNEFGYRILQPCVLFKVNRVIGFKVDPITNVEELPLATPESLKEYMVELNDNDVKGPNGRVWIACNTTNDNIHVKFYPHPYVDAKYLELKESIRHHGSKDAPVNQQYYNDDDYNRIVTMQITNVPLNKKIKFQCQLWAKNIVQLHKGSMSRGVIPFNLMIRSS